MIDVGKLRYDLAMHSAMVATIIEYQEMGDCNVPTTMMGKFLDAYKQYCAADYSELAKLPRRMAESERLMPDVAART